MQRILSVTKSRDTQRQKLYNAEDLAAKEMKRRNIVNKLIEDFSDLERRVKEITSSAFWKENYPNMPQVKVSDGRRRRVACYVSRKKEIKMPRWSRTELIILHELAHAAHDGRKDFLKSDPWHGWKFAETYLALVSRFMGRAEAAILKEEFRKGRVRYTPPRQKRSLTEEQREVLRARLAAARARRAVRADPAEVRGILDTAIASHHF